MLHIINLKVLLLLNFPLQNMLQIHKNKDCMQKYGKKYKENRIGLEETIRLVLGYISTSPMNRVSLLHFQQKAFLLVHILLISTVQSNISIRNKKEKAAKGFLLFLFM